MEAASSTPSRSGMPAMNGISGSWPIDSAKGMSFLLHLAQLAERSHCRDVLARAVIMNRRLPEKYR